MQQVSASFRPVSAAERIVLLDVLRGLAVFGILLANILLFAFPAGSPKVETPADSATTFFVSLFVEGKFYGMFCLLFGVGLALQNRRAQEEGKPFLAIYCRRLLILFIIGSLHAVFLFSADILTFYALCAFVALPFRGLSANRILRFVLVLYLAGFLVLGSYAWLHPQAPFPSAPDWQAMAESGPKTAAVHQRFVARVTGLWGGTETELYRFMAEEESIFREGTVMEMAQHRGVMQFLFILPVRTLLLSWQVIALFLLGLFIAQKRWYAISQDNRHMYRKVLMGCFVGGMTLQLLGGAAQLSGAQPLIPIFLIGTFGGALMLTLSYASGMALVCLRWRQCLPITSLAAVGRTALTNYIAQSVVCGFLFYGYGLAWFGSLTVSEVLLLTVPIFLLQLALSSVWLRCFRFGPLEWLWRSLTYWQFQPMR